MTQASRNKKNPNRRRSGAAMLMVLFVIFMVSSLVLNLLNTEVSQMTATRNLIDYERALYLANAGVHEACVELLNDPDWRGAVTDGAYPADDTYTATAAGGSCGVTITSVGVAGGATRTVEATIKP